MTKKINLKSKKFLIYSIFVGIVLFVISFYRAKTTSITYDEAFTYMNYVYDNPLKVFKTIFTNGTWANNHILNSFLISFVQFFAKGIRYSEILIRMPNLIFYVIYLIYAYKLSNKFKHKYFSYNLLAFNYGVHEFFGLARGYGMASSLVLVALYYLKLWLNENEKFKYLNLTYLFLVLSCYANTTSLIGFASILIFTFLILLKEKKILNYIKKSWFPIIVFIPTTLLIIRYHFMVSQEGLPLYGGTGSFFENVFVNLFKIYGFGDISKYIAITFVILFLISVILLRKKILKLNAFYLPLIYFILLVSLTMITKQMWLTGRCLIPFIPIFMYGICELIEDLNIDNIFGYCTISIILLTVFIINLDITKTREWSGDYEIKKIAYKSYETKNFESIKPHILNETTRFYKNKILYYFEYDIAPEL